MFGKLLLLILLTAATAAALLVNRQQRIDTAHDIAVLHQRIQSQEQTLWQLQSEVADRIRPGRLRQFKDDLGGSWVAIPTSPAHIRPVLRLALQHEQARELDEDLGG